MQATRSERSIRGGGEEMFKTGLLSAWERSQLSWGGFRGNKKRVGRAETQYTIRKTYLKKKNGEL